MNVAKESCQANQQKKNSTKAKQTSLQKISS